VRSALLTVLACMFLVAPRAAAPILCLGIAFVVSAALVEMERDAKRGAQRRIMLVLQFRSHAAAFTNTRQINARRLASSSAALSRPSFPF
jgi:hypothetical protein